MDNVYDIKKDKNLNFILPTKFKFEGSKNYISHYNVVVVVHLHYLDTLNMYFEYLKTIPDNIDVIVTTSVKEIEEKLHTYITMERKKYKIVKKQNRGRDVSSFLVTCKQDILNYDYVCFLHDKKEHSETYKQDTDQWIKCLWENMIGNDKFINNLLQVFEKNEKLGLLVPPYPISAHFSIAYRNVWENNFNTTRSLAEKLKLNCNLVPDKPPITIGTVFWAKVEALKKLFQFGWRYEDFDEEPMKSDGTISHAIERILAYVAQDSGFETGWVMTDKYASERFEYEQKILKKAFDRLKISAGVFLISELDDYEYRLQKLLAFIKDYKKIFIYGAGVYAKSCLAMLRNEHIWPDAFLVSKSSGNPKLIQNVPVYSIEQVELDQECGVIIGVGEQYQNAILQTLYEKNPKFTNIYIYT